MNPTGQPSPSLETAVTPGGALSPLGRAWLVALLGWTCVLTFYDLGGGAGFEPTDCWVVQTAREMHEAGDYLTPRFSGETRMQKSPGPYWAVIGVSLLRGEPISVAAGRMPNAVAAVLIVATVFWLTLRIAGERAAVFAGFAVSSSVLVLYWSHRAASDLGLAAWTTLALACFWVAAQQPRCPRRTWLYLAGYFAAGLGMLYKMPMPLVLVGFPAFLYVLLRNRWALLLDRAHLVGVVVFLLPWLPWVVATVIQEPTAVAKWRVEYLDRFTGDLPNVESQKTLAFYFLYLLPPLTYCLPWSLSLPGAIARSIRRPPGVSRDGALFMLIWFAAHFAFFTAATGKELRYFLPALPPLFVLLGIELAAFFDPRRVADERRDRLGALGVWIGVPLFFAGGAFVLYKWHKRAMLFEWIEVWPPYLVAALIFSVGAALAAWLYVRRREHAAFGATVAAMWGLWLWSWPKLMPILVSQAPFIDFAAQLRELADARPEWKHADVFQVGTQDSRIIWHSDLRIPRIIDQLALLEMQAGRRSLATEIRLVGEAMVNRLEGEKPVLLLASRPDYVLFLRDAPAKLAAEGRRMPRTYLWIQTRVGPKDRHFVLFGNRPPPWPEPPLTPPSGELARPSAGATSAAATAPAATSPEPGVSPDAAPASAAPAPPTRHNSPERAP